MAPDSHQKAVWVAAEQREEQEEEEEEESGSRVRHLASVPAPTGCDPRWMCEGGLDERGRRSTRRTRGGHRQRERERI